jgi:hypothetical protein
MQELATPFVRVWDWVTYHGGFPGQILFSGVLVCGVLAVVVWLTGKR